MVHNCNIFHFNCRWYCKNVFVSDIAIFVLKMLNSNQPKTCHHNTPFQHPQKGIHYSDLKSQIRYIHLKNSTFSAIMNKNHPHILHSNQWTCNQIGIRRQEMHSDQTACLPGSHVTWEHSSSVMFWFTSGCQESRPSNSQQRMWATINWTISLCVININTNPRFVQSTTLPASSTFNKLPIFQPLVSHSGSTARPKFSTWPSDTRKHSTHTET